MVSLMVDKLFPELELQMTLRFLGLYSEYTLRFLGFTFRDSLRVLGRSFIPKMAGPQQSEVWLTSPPPPPGQWVTVLPMKIIPILMRFQINSLRDD